MSTTGQRQAEIDGADRTGGGGDRLLAELNPPQREAVTHGEGPLLVLAGAGSGKTRVLTHRIAYLVATGQARPGEVLAITFTNKAADEMKERVEALVGEASRLMWVMTFHSACARILRREAERLGYTSGFTIYDEADSLRMLKRCMNELDVDPKRFPPRAIRAQVSAAKNRLLDAAEYREEQGSFFEETVADVFALYEKRLHAANAMDFDDLLVRTVNVLELFEDVRNRYQRAFRHILVDEYQDTNRAQYRLLQLLCGERRNLFVVGDDAQCLARGTRIKMADGSEKAIEALKAGDLVLSDFGSGDFRPATLTRVWKGRRAEGVEILTENGRLLVSTPEHTHFAGFKTGLTPQMHMTYLMWRQHMGFRVGTSRTYTNAHDASRIGAFMRSAQERADAVWVLSVHETEADARTAETILSLKYGLPCLPFNPRRGSSQNGVIHDLDAIAEVFSELDSVSGGFRLLADECLSFEHPHYAPLSFEGRRRNVTLTLCGEHRGRVPMHRVVMGVGNAEARRTLEDLGLNVRPARRNSKAWRYESAFKDYAEALETVDKIRSVLDVSVRRVARLGSRSAGTRAKNSLPMLPASSIRPGMAMFDEDGGYDLVRRVSRVPLDEPVYDIDVEHAHNFIASGLITHNSIYGFRSADIRNILDFERDFPGTRVVKLEQNYRSTQTVLDAANAVIANNRDQKPKHLWTDAAGGDPVQVHELDDEHAEARFVAGEIERLVEEEGESRPEIAVFYRTNAQSRVLEDTLVRFDMAYQVIGGTKFYERAEIKDAIAYLSLFVNPADSVSFARIVNTPRRGIGQTSQARILSHANTTGLPVLEVAAMPDRIPGLGPAAIKAVARFSDTIEDLRVRAAEGSSVADLLGAMLQASGYTEALEAERTIEAEGRVENLQELVGVAAEFDANRAVEGESEASPLEEFLQQISLYTDQDSLRADDELVTLMTLHNAKGLEYGTVFVIGCEEGVFPHSRSVEEGNLEEERRLCYVGITRAKRRLYLTCARRRNLFGAGHHNLPSRFLDELPEELVERHEPEIAIRTGWSLPGREEGRRRPAERRPTMQLETGDDVVHASFGEGVVTGVEPGGVIVVRFAGDGEERKLMAEYAPLRKR